MLEKKELKTLKKSCYGAPFCYNVTMTKTKPNTAELIKDVSADFRGNAKLYKLSSPVRYEDTNRETPRKRQTKFVVVSSVDMALDHGGSETFIFPADAKGKIQSWHELKGSSKGNLSHDVVLGLIGFNLVK
mgnify:FL=1